MATTPAVSRTWMLAGPNKWPRRTKHIMRSHGSNPSGRIQGHGAKARSEPTVWALGAGIWWGLCFRGSQ